jgi:glycosyltransferase involved in cell wall biosynthesis
MGNVSKKVIDIQICIPTFNRPQQLKKNVDNLLVLMRQYPIRILVIDNCSLVNPIDTELYRSVDGLTIIRNGANVGGQANVLRCFEYSDAEYLWIIGDDDFIDGGSINAALQTIRGNIDVDVFNLRCLAPGHKPCRQEYKGMDRVSFFRSIGTMNAIYYVVGYIFKTKSVKGGLRHAYLNLNYFCPHLAVVFAAKDVCFFSSDTIVHRWTQESDRNETLSPFPLLINVPNVLSEAKSISEYILLWWYIRMAKKDFFHPFKLVLVVFECARSGESRKANITRCVKYFIKNEIKIPTITGLLCVSVAVALSVFAPYSTWFFSKILNKIKIKGRRFDRYTDSDARI